MRNLGHPFRRSRVEDECSGALADLARIEACPLVARVPSNAADGAFLWIDRDVFRAPWIEAETVGNARMPIISRAEMQKFADHVTGYMRNGELAEGVFAALHAPGTAVRVVEGPFASSPGVVEDYEGDADLYRVTVSISGRAASIELGMRQMKAA